MYLVLYGEYPHIHNTESPHVHNMTYHVRMYCVVEDIDGIRQRIVGKSPILTFIESLLSICHC